MNILSLSPRRPQPANPQTALVDLQAQLYREARSAPRPLRQLMTWLLDRRNLEAAWDRVADADGAATPGPDGVTCHDVRNQLANWLGRLADDLYHRRYRPLPPRWIDVPKANKPGATRRLGILSVRDRVVHTALKQVLEPILEPIFLPGSFGFRPGRSVPGALAAALALLSAPEGEPVPFTHAVQLDVADCFDTLDHTLLRSELARHVADPEVARLLDLILPVGGSRSGRLWWQRTHGLVQGSSLSPLLCNLCLHPLDQALSDLAQSTQNGVRLLRYADDLLLLARDARLAQRGLDLTRQVVRQLQQGLRPGSAPRPLMDGVDWLGVRLQPRGQRWTGQTTFGYVVPDARVVSMLERLTEMTAPPSARIDGSAFNLARWIVSINEQMRDWRQAYVYADNAPEVFRVLDDATRWRVGQLLQSVTGKRGPQLLREYRVRLPRGFWTWEVPGARLTVLSSLAPLAPANLTRRPSRMQRGPATPAAAPARPAPLALPMPAVEESGPAAEDSKEVS